MLNSLSLIENGNVQLSLFLIEKCRVEFPL